MREPIDAIVSDLPVPEPDLLARARRETAFPERHDEFMRQIEALHRVEQRPTETALPWPGHLRVAAFNTERLAHPDAARALLDASGAHVALLSEVDDGMARSGNGRPLREMIGAAGDGYVYGVEFVELDLGNAHEMQEHAGARNARGFHGNAIVSKLALEAAHVIPLDDGGFWFSGHEGTERRVGGRIAVAARIADAPHPLWVAAVHLESKSDADDRHRQIRRLLQAIERLGPDDAWVIGGDLNTKTMPDGKGEREGLLASPERHEPLFGSLKEAGFTWAGANLAEPTQRTGPQNKPQPPFRKLDWLAFRGLRASNPAVLPALDRDERPISDHELVAADFSFP
ncbi:endonuclease/exonuclease/phosphatase family protein [Microvirga rosea]|uniref:endonuclease/exonuclease/phosphatase family protein n=1 Tax=Microvirga rosea TaxID=2715425 RepID=UPI001D0B7F42|nr:endonuclease/exonuclease/phosphatase family protein [Microvirga rosea]MCB8820072.1 endonuclease/exonuclease/phosphatase family protein [Microvirga rosea]